MIRRTLARFALIAAVGAVPFVSLAQEPGGTRSGTAATKVFEKPFADPRLSNVRTLYQGSGFKGEYKTEEEWKTRAQFIREQVLIAAGLWPLPPRPALSPVVHSPIDRGDYTVEKVFFQSHPNFYVTGNLYRPKGKKGPFPAVISPHGHWANGRLYEAPAKEVDRQLKAGEEKDPVAAKYPLQARCANLAKLGCVVFHYDMVGYADHFPELYPHRKTFIGAEYDQALTSVFGLQTWNSMRAIDFVCSLPDVDQSRIACTGASGGGTQTFAMMATDDRLKVAAPVCMISHDNHQGGCVCENNSLLRLGTDNVEISAAFAPKPFIHPTTSGDWTKAYLEHGLPETRAIYKLFAEESNVQAMRQEAPHNYNLKSREAVYNFFNQHLKLRHEGTIAEQKFEPVEPKDLSVFDEQHPKPKDAASPEALQKYLTTASLAQLYALKPMDPSSLERFRYVVGTALKHMMATSLPGVMEVATEVVAKGTVGNVSVERVLFSRKGSGEKLPALVYTPANPIGVATILVHPEEKEGFLKEDGSPGEMVAALLEKGHTVVLPDLFLTGELHPASGSAGNGDAGRVTHNGAPKVEFFAGYNRTTLANRVHDILTVVACTRARSGVGTINLVGHKYAGPWVLLARPFAGEVVARTVADGDHSNFERVAAVTHYDFVPGSRKYGGLWTMASLAAPAEIMVYQTGAREATTWMEATYAAAGAADKLKVSEEAADVKRIVEWLVR